MRNLVIIRVKGYKEERIEKKVGKQYPRTREIRGKVEGTQKVKDDVIEVKERNL
jgi:hypothetical protein